MRVAGLFVAGVGGASAGLLLSIGIVYALLGYIDFSAPALIFIVLFLLAAAGVSVVASVVATLAHKRMWLSLTLGGTAALGASVLMWNQPWVLYPAVHVACVTIGWVAASGLFLRATDRRDSDATDSAAQPAAAA